MGEWVGGWGGVGWAGMQMKGKAAVSHLGMAGNRKATQYQLCMRCPPGAAAHAALQPKCLAHLPGQRAVAQRVHEQHGRRQAKRAEQVGLQVEPPVGLGRDRPPDAGVCATGERRRFWL